MNVDRPTPSWLLAVDMDGTLLRNDKSVAPADVLAIRGAAARGITVTIATGRLATGTMPTARALGLAAPLVCADGGLLIDPVTGVAIDRFSIASGHADRAVRVLVDHGLTPYVFLADAIHCDTHGERHRAVIDVWSQDFVVHDSLPDAHAWKSDDGVSMTVGLGAREAVESAAAVLQDEHAHALDTVHFGMAGMTVWAVRSLPKGCDKGMMLGRLATRLGLPPARVAAVGDWFNDLGMFKYAGRSFAMGQAPDLVREAASDVLRATSATGGGVAEAIEALLAAAKPATTKPATTKPAAT